MKDLMNNSTAKKLSIAIGALLVLLVVFSLGMHVGYRQAAFSYQWSDNYARHFGGPASPFMDWHKDGRDGPRIAHGASGLVIAVKLPQVVIKGPAEAEKIILVGSTTPIRRYHDMAASTSIDIGDSIIAIGSPDSEGDIVASFIRIIPAPETGSTSMPLGPNPRLNH